MELMTNNKYNENRINTSRSRLIETNQTGFPLHFYSKTMFQVHAMLQRKRKKKTRFTRLRNEGNHTKTRHLKDVRITITYLELKHEILLVI